jgi:uncharacterized membrane protein
LAIVISPKAVKVDESVAASVTDAQIVNIIEQRCASCHADQPTDDIFKTPQGGVIFSGIDSIKQWAPRIKARAIDSQDMPFMNKTKMTEQERQQLAGWIAQQEK